MLSYPGIDELEGLAKVSQMRFEVLELTQFMSGEVGLDSVTTYGHNEDEPVRFRMGFCYVGEPMMDCPHFIVLQIWQHGGVRVQLSAWQQGAGLVISVDSSEDEGQDAALPPPECLGIKKEAAEVSVDPSEDKGHDAALPHSEYPGVKKEAAEVKLETHGAVNGRSKAPRVKHLHLCSVEIPPRAHGDTKDNPKQRWKKATTDRMLLGAFDGDDIPNSYITFTNDQKVIHDGCRCQSMRWVCVSCKPRCGFRGRVLQTGPATAVVQYVEGSCTSSHRAPVLQRSVVGATTEQRKIIVENRHVCATAPGLLAKFGLARVPPPKKHVLERELLPALRADPVFQEQRPASLSRGALFGFLKGRDYENLSPSKPESTLFIIGRTNMAVYVLLMT